MNLSVCELEFFCRNYEHKSEKKMNEADKFF